MVTLSHPVWLDPPAKLILVLESKLCPFLGTQTMFAGKSLKVTEALPLCADIWCRAALLSRPCLKESSSQSITLRFKHTEDFLKREGLEDTSCWSASGRSEEAYEELLLLENEDGEADNGNRSAI